MIIPTRIASVLLLTVVLVACGSSSSSSSSSGGSGDGGGGGGGGGGSGACGLTLTGPKWASDCQTWSDTYCCNQEKACAADAACAKLIACMDACPAPRQDACLNACAPDGGGPGADLLNAFGTCSKTTPSNGKDIPSTCEWPTE